MLKVGVIGLGKMGMVHLMNAMKIRNVEVVAVADSSKRALKKAEKLGVENTYTDFEELMKTNSNLDAVIISLPNFLHSRSVMLALQNGMNVFIEKPLAPTTRECKEIVELAQEKRKKVMVGYVMRFFDDIAQIKNTIDKGYIGQPEVITLESISSGPFSHGIVPLPVPEWWFDLKRAGGGVMLDLGCHLLDVFQYLVGDYQLITSHLDYKFNLALEDTAIAVVKAKNSSTKGIVHVGWYESTEFPRRDFNITVHGDSGNISIRDLQPSNVYAYAAKEGLKNLGRKIIGKEIKPLAYAYNLDAFHKELKHFFNCIIDDSEPRASAIDGLKTVEIIEQIYNRSK